MALYGLVPVPEIQFADFIYPAYDQIVNELAKYPLPLGRRVPGQDGDPHAGRRRHPRRPLPLAAPESQFIHVAGLKVVCPSNPVDAKGLLLAVDPRPGSGAVSSSRSASTARPRARCPRASTRCRSAKRAIVRTGADVTVLAWGAMLYEALDAATKAAAQGVEAEVIDLRTLWPVDIDTIVESVKKTGRVVVVHEAPRTCGFGAELLRLVDEKAFFHLEAPPVRVTGFDTPFPYTLEMEYLPLSHRILPALLKVAQAG